MVFLLLDFVRSVLDQPLCRLGLGQAVRGRTQPSSRPQRIGSVFKSSCASAAVPGFASGDLASLDFAMVLFLRAARLPPSSDQAIQRPDASVASENTQPRVPTAVRPMSARRPARRRNRVPSGPRRRSARRQPAPGAAGIQADAGIEATAGMSFRRRGHRIDR